MACCHCERAWDLDKVPRPCKTAAGCWVPSLQPGPARVLEMRNRLVKLSHLGIGDSILRIYGAGRDELDMLDALTDIEREIERDLSAPAEENPDGP